MCINKKLSRIFYPRPSFCSIPKTLTPNFQRIRVQSEAAVSSSSPTLQRLRVETRDGVTVTKRGRKQISRASSSSTPEKIRRPPPESRASFSPFLPNPPLHHSLHVQLLLIPQQKQAQQQTQSQNIPSHHHQQPSESEECRSVGPSC